MNSIGKLRKPYKVALLVLLISIIGFAATAFLIPTRLDIPLGIIVSGAIISLLNFLQGIAEKYDNHKHGVVFSILMIIFKFVVVVVFIVMAALMYYRWDLPYFNIFSTIGVYTVSILSTILVYILDKE